ncbi:hypothetical protein [Bradyrhizobium sp. UFLA03-84]|uniref:hypothetical protein n=1 Tax=Bradyrhizobium sp. UFLA03-84 TaxID=418599 RepID=UPI001177F8F2|nr:hypothetical protein [Bradyrhizobium sp. UFLA03-84]
MSHTFYVANRATHHRIVALALIAGIAVTIIGLHTHRASGIDGSRSGARIHLPVEHDDLRPVAVAELR